METYVATIVVPNAEAKLELDVPFSPESPISAFAEELRRRCKRYAINLDDESLLLRLGRGGGPVLNENDILRDVVIDPQSQRVFVTLQGGGKGVDAVGHLW